jgi:hypothetical protein
MNIILRSCRIWSVCILFLTMVHPHILLAQEREYLAMIPPFHDRLRTMEVDDPIQLKYQRFVLFIYRNAVVVYLEADFVNTSIEPIIQEFALPSTGHNENGVLPGGRISTGILSVQLWVQGKKIVPDFINTGKEEWYTIQTQYAPGEQRKVKALFWAQTSLTDVDSIPGLDTVTISNGKRGFMIDLSHAAIWNSAIETININAVFMDSLNSKQESFNADPPSYEVQDSILIWKLNNVEPSANDNIFV